MVNYTFTKCMGVYVMFENIGNLKLYKIRVIIKIFRIHIYSKYFAVCLRTDKGVCKECNVINNNMDIKN